MKYYKIVKNNVVRDAIKYLNYVGYNTKEHVALMCNANQNPIGILSTDNKVVWHLTTMRELTQEMTENVVIETVDMIEIEEEEYNVLYNSLEELRQSEEENNGIPNEDENTPQMVDPLEYSELEVVKAAKISELRTICHNTIVAGFDIDFDGVIKHFDFDEEDQINIAAYKEGLSSGETEFPYHASNELCRMYNAAEMAKIVEAGTNTKVWHTTYYNSLKYWVNSLEDKYVIYRIQYGDTIPEEYQSDVLKMLISQAMGTGSEGEEQE